MAIASTPAQAIANLTPEPIQTVDLGVGIAVCHRIIGTMGLSTVATDANNQWLYIGIGVQQVENFDTSDVPAASDTFSKDWYYWHAQPIRYLSGDTSHREWTFDIKSKRRLRNGQALVISVDNADGNNDALDFTASMRLLWSQG